VALNGRKVRGAFLPFEKEKRVELPASSTTAAASSTVAGDSGDKAASVNTAKHSSGDKETTANKGKESQSSSSGRKRRRCWAPDLHRRFLQALQQLGGSHGWCPSRLNCVIRPAHRQSQIDPARTQRSHA
jgi:SHAQKYF class myb-like DNA-binding protein